MTRTLPRTCSRSSMYVQYVDGTCSPDVHFIVGASHPLRPPPLPYHPCPITSRFSGSWVLKEQGTPNQIISSLATDSCALAFQAKYPKKECVILITRWFHSFGGSRRD